MDFLYNNASELNDSKKQLIKGTFYKCIRNKKMITLTDAAKELNLNKGFLSELENGKRHFPDGLDSLMNDLYHVSFSDNENNYFKCDNILTDAYNSFFDTNSEREKNILTTAVNENDYLEYSYSYFSFLIIKLFYYLRVIHNNSKVENYIKTIEKYTSAYSEYQLSIFYSLKGIYLKRNNRLIEYSIFAFQKSSLLCKAFSTVYAMNSFQLISLYAESNHLGIALKYCHTAKDVLRYKNNYW